MRTSSPQSHGLALSNRKTVFYRPIFRLTVYLLAYRKSCLASETVHFPCLLCSSVHSLRMVHVMVRFPCISRFLGMVSVAVRFPCLSVVARFPGMVYVAVHFPCLSVVARFQVLFVPVIILPWSTSVERLSGRSYHASLEIVDDVHMSIYSV